MRGKQGLLMIALMVSLALLAGCLKQPQTAATDSAALGLLLLDAEDGVYVLAVSDRSPAHQAGLQPGDCLVLADGVPLESASAFNDLLPRGQETILLTVRRGGQELRLELPCR